MGTEATRPKIDLTIALEQAWRRLQHTNCHGGIYLSKTRFSGHLKLMFGPTKGRKVCNVIAHNIILTNQKTESFVFPWLRSHSTFDVTCFPAFVGASDIISSILSLRLFEGFTSHQQGNVILNKTDGEVKVNTNYAL